MHCRKIREWLVKEPESLSGHQREELSNHLKTCDKCNLAFQHLANLKNEIRRAKETSVPQELIQDIWQNVRLNIEKEPILVKPKFRSLQFRRHPLAAWGIPSFAVLCILFIFLLIKPWNALSPENDLKPTSLDVAIESAQINGKPAQISIFEIRNPDMTFIWLDKNETNNGG